MEVGNKTIAQLAEELAQIPFFQDIQPEKLLDKIPFFEGLSQEVVSKVVEQALLLQFLPGQEICRQGDYEDTFYVILAGEVEVSSLTQYGKRMVLGTLGQGDFFGEMGPISGHPRTATITALQKTVVLQLPKTLFLKVLRSSPAIKSKIDQKYIERSLQTHLRQVSLFSSLSGEVLDKLAERVELVSFDKDEVIIRQGDIGDCLYLIRGGFVKVSAGPLEDEKILTYLREGSYFGEMALLGEEKRTANVVAMTDVEAVRIGKDDFQELMDQYPEVEEQARSTVAEREKSSEEVRKDPRLARAIKFIVQKGLAQAREILVVDLDKCVGCDHCVRACEAVRGNARIERRGSRLGKFLVPTSCFHCENPQCLLCPRGGIVRDKDGEIHFTEFCIGCGGCARRCPYGNILIVEPEEEKPGLLKRLFRRGEEEEPEKRKQVVKCDMCADYRHMACVYNCPTGAMTVMTPEELIKAYE
ncbi:MAG: cyclic nucleotide-binding domain-containing protein [bacterium]